MNIVPGNKIDLINETKVHLHRVTYYVYQDSDGNVIWPAINFINFIIKEGNNDSTIETYRQAIRSLFNYILDNKRDWMDINDELLGVYAEWQLRQSINNPRWRGDTNTTKRNINHDYLAPVYEFYFWAQKQGLHPSLLGVQPEQGDKYQITSALPLRDKAKSKKDGPKKKQLYPKSFSNCGESSGGPSQKAEEWELDELNDYIRVNYKGYTRASLMLMLRIVDQTGSRPITLSGFAKLQFRKETVESELMNTSDSILDITPIIQKGDNNMPIKFPLTLVNGVVSFIENDLKEFINTIGLNKHDGHLFLNEKDGKPLSAQEITKIFSAITKKLNWPKGKSLYAFRHRYANEQMDIQASINDELGFTKEENAVALQVSQNMTHKNHKTLLKEYLESRTRHGFKTKVYQQELMLQELRAQKEYQNLETLKALELAEEQRKIVNKLRQEIERLKRVR
ncbi:hypothetical protein ESZ36_08230 [Colwellia demingiae]|uniref:Site-specific integrase n=1 Tax=Colwellia demingiae TaxID=89401 RepID=A0A5C6QIQ1_9GAMM|nr:hypothetical protein [Colwellia demingiae]TWX68478.1 hypothetical protein ESZ36_08230 [Colwellia demingiae]